MLNNVLYADLTGVFLVVGCTLFISLVNCLSEIPTMSMKVRRSINCSTGVYGKCRLYQLISLNLVMTGKRYADSRNSYSLLNIG